MKLIPLSVPNLKGNELKYVTDAVELEWVSTGGGYIKKFEEDIAGYLKVQDAVACQSGTAGLHISLLLAGVSQNDEVIVPTLTFIATVNPVRYLRAEPIFMDCDDTLNMDLDKLTEFCENECYVENTKLINKITNKHIKAVIVVHVFGNMLDMEKLMSIANQYHLLVIEDAAEALGTLCTKGKFKGRFAGTIGDFGVFSFNGNKILTTGGGGMLVAKEASSLNQARYLTTQAKDDELYYIHNEVGYNYRMTNVQAAIGVAQLEQLEDFITIKSTNFDAYSKRISEIQGLSLLKFNDECRPNYWFYSLLIDYNRYGLKRDDLLNVLVKRNIQTRPIWGLIHTQKPYLNNQSYKIEKAYYYLDSILNLPCSSNLSIKDVHYICDVLEELQR